jgi:hypothetical protein
MPSRERLLAFIDEIRAPVSASGDPGPPRTRGWMWNFTAAVSPLGTTPSKRGTVSFEILGLDVRMEVRFAHIPGISEASWKALEEAL